MSDQKTILVAGATGTQGGAVVDALLDNHHKVVGLTRNPQSDAAKQLIQKGVEVRAGDLSDINTLKNVAQDVDAAFIMTTPFESGTDAEVKQGVTTIDALKAADIGHIVYTSVGSANQNTGVPHFDSKYEVETYLRQSGVPYTIMAPVYFMDNLTLPWNLPNLQQRMVSVAMPTSKPLQQVAVKNIGEFAAALFERGEQVFGKRYDIAGDELNWEQAVAEITEASGQKFTLNSFPSEALKAQSEDLALMFKWFDDVGYSADIYLLKTEFPEVNWVTFKEWLADRDWRILDQASVA